MERLGAYRGTSRRLWRIPPNSAQFHAGPGRKEAVYADTVRQQGRPIGCSESVLNLGPLPAAAPAAAQSQSSTSGPSHRLPIGCSEPVHQAGLKTAALAHAEAMPQSGLVPDVVISMSPGCPHYAFLKVTAYPTIDCAMNDTRNADRVFYTFASGAHRVGGPSHENVAFCGERGGCRPIITDTNDNHVTVRQPPVR